MAGYQDMHARVALICMQYIYSLQCSKGSRLGHDCAYQGVINYHRVFPVCPY
jgi:hypothetical protein